jgi:hypothetical protein
VVAQAHRRSGLRRLPAPAHWRILLSDSQRPPFPWVRSTSSPSRVCAPWFMIAASRSCFRRSFSSN